MCFTSDFPITVTSPAAPEIFTVAPDALIAGAFMLRVAPAFKSRLVYALTVMLVAPLIVTSPLWEIVTVVPPTEIL